MNYTLRHSRVTVNERTSEWIIISDHLLSYVSD